MVRRAQVSLEFLMVVGVAMVLLTASSLAIYEFTQTRTDQSDMQQVAAVGYQMVNQAANVYVYGLGSFVRISGNIPDSVHQIYIVENDTIVFEVETRQGIVPVQVFSDIAINGTAREGEKVYVNESGSQIQYGNVGFRVESKGSWVEISQVR